MTLLAIASCGRSIIGICVMSVSVYAVWMLFSAIATLKTKSSYPTYRL
ncbi:hypothetical protein [Nostoc sp. MS1]|nr:hypothetical protein [Nostoc sp. MS1]